MAATALGIPAEGAMNCRLTAALGAGQLLRLLPVPYHDHCLSRPGTQHSAGRLDRAAQETAVCVRVPVCQAVVTRAVQQFVGIVAHIGYRFVEAKPESVAEKP